VSSPYIVTTKRHAWDSMDQRGALLPYPERHESVSRRAVTPEEAQRIIEFGGTAGPLPDGTVIEVEAVTWQMLWYVSDLDAEELAGALGGIEACRRRILDAYNARQESAV
jgi:hypothetical protein